MNRPTLSVVLPFRNSRATLRAAIESVLGQTWTDFELLLFDDASTDDSLAIARGISDPRIRLFDSATHAGYVALLNRGLDEARGEFVARMDADDLSRPQRFARQLELLRREPQVGICGTWARRFRDETTVNLWRTPVTANEVLAQAFHECPFVHPSVMLRREVLRETGLRYDPARMPAEDYSLWVELLEKTSGRNVPEVLVDYRLSTSQVSQVNAEKSRRMRSAIYARYLAQLGLPTDETTLARHHAIFDGQWSSGEEFVVSSLAWLERIAAANDERRRFPAVEFAALLAQRALNLCRVAAPRPRVGWRLFRASRFARAVPFWQKENLSFALACLRPSPG